MADVAEIAEAKPCSNPGCDKPGTSCCSPCKTTFYCGSICQTADWPKHKEECDGHLRKMGKAHLAKAMGFQQQNNWMQALRYGEIAASKLKQLKDRRLETVQAISDALTFKYDALGRMARHREALDCIKECYTLWAMHHLRNPGSMRAALGLIQSCIHNKEYEDAERYARHAYFMIAEMTDNFIPSEQYPQFLADVSYLLSQAIYRYAKAGGIPPEEQQKVGEEAIALARKALELHTQLYGTESSRVASDIGALADALEYFNNIDNDEIFRLREQTLAIYRRVEGNSSINVSASEFRLGEFFIRKAASAKAAKEWEQCTTNLERSVRHYTESARIDRVNNDVEGANKTIRMVAKIEENIRQIQNDIAAATTANRG